MAAADPCHVPRDEDGYGTASEWVANEANSPPRPFRTVRGHYRGNLAAYAGCALFHTGADGTPAAY